MATPSQILDSPVLKFALAAFNPLLAAAPEFAKIFMDKSSGQTVPERNVAGVIKMVSIAQEALQASGRPAQNAQAVAEAVTTDPAAKQVVREALLQNLWQFDMTEAGGGGIAGARKFIEDVADKSGGVMWRIIAVVTYAALAFLAVANGLALTVYIVAMVRENESQLTASMQLLGTVVQADIGAALMAFGFWLGSSFGSRQKDGRGAAQT